MQEGRGEEDVALPRVGVVGGVEDQGRVEGQRGGSVRGRGMWMRVTRQGRGRGGQSRKCVQLPLRIRDVRGIIRLTRPPNASPEKIMIEAPAASHSRQAQSTVRTWIVRAQDSDRKYIGNHGYADELGTRYCYHSFVPNWRQLDVGHALTLILDALPGWRWSSRSRCCRAILTQRIRGRCGSR